MDIQVKNPQGEIEAVKDADLPSLVSKGYQIPNQEYEFQDEEGKKLAVPASDFKKAIDTGWKYRDAATKKDEELEKKYGDSSVKALLYGAARGATFGASDVVLEKTGLASEEELKEIKDRNQVASVLGDVTGTIVPAVLSGGTGLLAKVAAKTPAALASKVALKAGEKAATKLAAKSATTQAIGRASAAAATEGFLVGEGQLISEASLGDAEFNAESLMAYGGTGAVLGGATGALGQVGLDVFKKTASKSRELIKGLATKLDDKDHAQKVLKTLGLEEQAEQAIFDLNPNADVEGAFSRLGMDDVAPWLKSQDPATQMLGADLAKRQLTVGGRLAAKDATRVQENIEMISNSLLRDAKSVAEEDFGTVAADALLSGIRKKREPFTKLYGEIEEYTKQLGFAQSSINSVEKNLAKTFFYKRDENYAKALFDRLRSLSSLDDLKKFNTELGSELKSAINDPNKYEFLSELISSVKTIRKETIDEAEKIVPELAEKNISQKLAIADKGFAELNKDISYLSELTGRKFKSITELSRVIEGIDKKKLVRKLTNPENSKLLFKVQQDFPALADMARSSMLAEIKDKSITKNKFGQLVFNGEKFSSQLRGLSDDQLKFLIPWKKDAKDIVEAIGVAARQLPKDMNPSGTSLADFMKEVISPVYYAQQAKDAAAYLLLTRGDEGVINYIKNFGVPLSNIQKKSGQTASKLTSAAKGFLDSTGRLARTSSVKAFTPSETQLERAKNVYEQVQAQPEELQKRLEANNRQLGIAAPNTNAAYQNRVMAGVTFLASKVPKRSETYAADNYKPSQSQLLMFNEYLAGVEQPFKVFEQVKQGYASPRSLEAIKVVYPKLYDRFQQAVLDGLSKKKNLTNFQRNRIQEIIGVKLSPSQDPEVMMLLQQPSPMQQPQQGMQAPRKIAKGKDFGNARRSMSSVDRVTYRE